MYASILALTTFLLGASAGAVLPRQECGPSATWSATNFRWGSSPGGTIGGYNLTAPDNYIPGAPGFNVYCTSIAYQRGWLSCVTPEGTFPAPQRVEVIWTSRPAIYDDFFLGAAHIWQDEQGEWTNVTAGARVPAKWGEKIDFTYNITTIAKSGTAPGPAPTPV